MDVCAICGRNCPFTCPIVKSVPDFRDTAGYNVVAIMAPLCMNGDHSRLLYLISIISISRLLFFCEICVGGFNSVGN